MTMTKSYRMEVTATLCFSVKADSEEEAIAKSRAYYEQFENGLAVPECFGHDKDGVFYTSCEDTADVIDEEVEL